MSVSGVMGMLGAAAEDIRLRIASGHPPANTYVALMQNFFVPEGTKRVAARTKRIEAMAALSALQPYHGQEVVIGVRPQRLKLDAPAIESDQGALLGRLIVHEFLGKDGIAQAEVDHTVLECITPPIIPFQAGDPVALTAAFEDLLFFDPETTRRIEY